MSSAINHKKRSHRSQRLHPREAKVWYVTPGYGRRRGGLLNLLRKLLRHGRGGKYGTGE